MKLIDKLKEDKKKDGFTLIEIIAVIAIIGMIAAVLLPKIGGYIKDAKKLKVVESSRKVVMAVEVYNLKASREMDKSTSVSDAIQEDKIKNYIGDAELQNLNVENTTIKNCYDIVNGAEFDFLENSDELDPSTINCSDEEEEDLEQLN